ncbi:MAG: YmdB family metallophosphoesterase [Robiginitomaculum sp.]|nr:YmdB family metallophosphoesterase [Robiginitomaculum sp.]
MKALLLGDVVGRSGRNALADHLPQLIKDLQPDFVLANGENAAGGFGITHKTAQALFACGVDVITLGNHAFDQPEALSLVAKEPMVLRPANYPPGAGVPGQGTRLHQGADGRRVLVVTVMGRIYMDALDDPFAAVEKELEACGLAVEADMIIIEIHGEASSEKGAMGHFCDGRASVVFGTHTHIPTADARILEGGTAFMTDLGMCGDYGGVIGMDKEEPVRRFTTRLRGSRFTPADGEGTLSGLYVETDDKTGLAISCSPVRVGGCLSPCIPKAIS